MANVIVAFSRQENARNIRNILVKSGFHVVSVCTSGAQILSAAEELDRGVVVGGGKFPDMVYGEVCRMLPEEFFLHCGLLIILLVLLQIAALQIAYRRLKHE